MSWLGIAGELRNLYFSEMSIDPAYRATLLLFRSDMGGCPFFANIFLWLGFYYQLQLLPKL